MPLMTKSQYARHREVHPAAITKALKAGRISVVIDAGGNEKIDSVQADKTYKANTDPSRGKTPETYSDARAKNESLKAQMAQLEYDKLIEKLVDADEVEQTWLKIATIVRSKILSLPTKLKQIHPELALEVFTSLEAACREALEEIANAGDSKDS